MSAEFQRALEGFRAICEREASDQRLNPACRSVLLNHGSRTEKAIVFLHGITSSPVQFAQLGALFHEHGYNVLIPLMPRHGLADRLNTGHARLSRAELKQYADTAVDIGTGLGERLIVAGLSVSGILAAYCFQQRKEVSLAVPISPFFAPFRMPIHVVPFVATVLKKLPNLMIWWDARRRAKLGPPTGYPRFSTHAMAESLLLGGQIYSQADHMPPAGNAALVITNPRDMAVSNAATRALVRRWQTHAPGKVHTYEFSRTLGANHDIIAPYQPWARVDVVYPILLDLIQAAST